MPSVTILSFAWLRPSVTARVGARHLRLFRVPCRRTKADGGARIPRAPGRELRHLLRRQGAQVRIGVLAEPCFRAVQPLALADHDLDLDRARLEPGPPGPCGVWQLPHPAMLSTRYLPPSTAV